MKPIQTRSSISFERKPNKHPEVTITIPRGKIIKYGGIPFELKNDTFVYGFHTNYQTAKQNRTDSEMLGGESNA
jgi:hypothetical protein